MHNEICCVLNKLRKAVMINFFNCQIKFDTPKANKMDKIDG